MKSHKNYTKIVFKLYFFNLKRLLVVLLVMVRSVSLLSQNDQLIQNSLQTATDSVVTDTIRGLKRLSPDALEKQVTYTSAGYIKNDVINKKATIVDQAVVNYDNIKITADSIEFDMETSEVFAVGLPDSTGKINGKPVLEVGSQKYETDTLRYNFKTGVAVVKVIVTQQDEGLLRSSIGKMLDDGTSNIYRSSYSTCDAEIPHFYISLPKAKVYPGKKIISGPGHLVLEGIPLPLYLPFGFFPIQTKSAESGIIMPKVHYEEGRGYALTDGGYYFALSNYFDLTLKGSIYTNGTWMATAQTAYNKRYKYSGNFSFSYAKNISGHKGLSDYNASTNYSLGWNFNQDSKARPGSRFNASVDMSSSGFDRNNSYEIEKFITTTKQSSISYSKSWTGTPFNLSVSMNHSQNTKTDIVNLNLPKVSFSASRIYPFRGVGKAGTGKWYKDLQLQYTADLDNRIVTQDSLLFTSKVWNNMQNGFSHRVPLSLQFRPFNNFSISPQVSYEGVIYTQKINKTWDPNFVNPITGVLSPSAVIDTTRGFFYGHALKPSISAGYSPQIFGTYQFTNPNARIQAIRHVIKPSVSFSYVPYFKQLATKMYRKVQADTTGRTEEYSIFQGGIYGTPSLSQRNGAVSFSLTNLLEAKVFERGDTTGKPQKVNIIDNFGINTSYNIFADSMKWSPVSMVIRTTLFKNINISGSSSFSLYGLDKNGRQTGSFYFSTDKKLMRLTNVSASVDFSLDRLFEGKNKKQAAPVAAQIPEGSYSQVDQASAAGSLSQTTATDIYDDYGYMKFDVPWSMNVSYRVDYSKNIKSTLSQYLSLNGHVALTKKMDITYRTGYDFTAKEITTTQISVVRDLHCWNMSFSWIPNGTMKSWEFTIRVKAAVLSDLKYQRTKDYHDNY
jgi:hypothetical protein